MKIQKIFSKINVPILIIAIIFLSTVSMTSYWRYNFNKGTNVLEQVVKQKAPADFLIAATTIDFHNSTNLYRKIWTYNSILFFCGFLLIYVFQTNKK